MKDALLKKTDWKTTLLYICAGVLLFCLVSLPAFFEGPETQSLYLFLQMGYLGIGVLHTWLVYRFLPWLDRSAFLPGLLLTLAQNLLGALGVLVFLWAIRRSDHSGFYASASVLFTFPFLVAKAFEYFLRIPPKTFRKWYYPVGSDMPDIDTIDLSKILVVQFEFPKKADEALVTNFKAKAPLAMPFGDLFLIFINDYNERNPDSPIQYLDEQGKPFGWLFYPRSSWWKRRRYFDPALTFQQNRIVDNTVIVTVRA